MPTIICGTQLKRLIKSKNKWQIIFRGISNDGIIKFYTLVHFHLLICLNLAQIEIYLQVEKYRNG